MNNCRLQKAEMLNLWLGRRVCISKHLFIVSFSSQSLNNQNFQLMLVREKYSQSDLAFPSVSIYACSCGRSPSHTKLAIGLALDNFAKYVSWYYLLITVYD